jgi:ABC-type multidrug transport system fused ATPase/permease subunit
VAVRLRRAASLLDSRFGHVRGEGISISSIALFIPRLLPWSAGAILVGSTNTATLARSDERAMISGVLRVNGVHAKYAEGSTIESQALYARPP